jgi:predicted small secreted protein
MSFKFPLLTLALVAFAGLALTACNTMEGAGRDIQGAGSAVEDAAQ